MAIKVDGVTSPAKVDGVTSPAKVDGVSSGAAPSTAGTPMGLLLTITHAS